MRVTQIIMPTPRCGGKEIAKQTDGDEAPQLYSTDFTLKIDLLDLSNTRSARPFQRLLD